MTASITKGDIQILCLPVEEPPKKWSCQKIERESDQASRFNYQLQRNIGEHIKHKDVLIKLRPQETTNLISSTNKLQGK